MIKFDIFFVNRKGIQATAQFDLTVRASRMGRNVQLFQVDLTCGICYATGNQNQADRFCGRYWSAGGFSRIKPIAGDE
jgi:hypothetical protein